MSTDREERKRRERRLATVNKTIPEIEGQIAGLRGEADAIWAALFPRLTSAFRGEVTEKRDLIDVKNREADRLAVRLRSLQQEKIGLLSDMRQHAQRDAVSA